MTFVDLDCFSYRNFSTNVLATQGRSNGNLDFNFRFDLRGGICSLWDCLACPERYEG